jgi:GDP-4-dehydro-6-deoxy-D-mannose reductase
MTKLLVTGLSGFVGSYLAEREDVCDLGLEGRPVDLTSRSEVLAAVVRARPAAVIHLAAQSSVALANGDPARTYRVNFDGTLHLLDALKEAGFKGRMLYVGSGDVYGSVSPEQLPVVEDGPLRPRNPYAVSKVAAEALCYQWSQTGPFEIVMARPFNHIGPRQGTAFAVADFARQITAHRRGRGPALLRVGDIDATRDFTDVRDIVTAYLDLLSRGRSGEVYNVCSGAERSLREMIEGLFEAAGVRMPIEVDAQRLRPSEQRRMCGSYSKLQSHTGWQPRIPLQQTLADIVEYWDEEESA